MRNRHFAPQDWMLAADRMPYTRIYKTSEMPELLEEFEAHLRANGWDGRAARALARNETPLKPIAGLFPPEVLDRVARALRGRLGAFGYADPMPGGLDPADRYDAGWWPRSGGWSSARSGSTTWRCGPATSSARRWRPPWRADQSAVPQPSRVRRLAWRAKRRLVSG